MTLPTLRISETQAIKDSKWLAGLYDISLRRENISGVISQSRRRDSLDRSYHKKAAILEV